MSNQESRPARDLNIQKKIQAIPLELAYFKNLVDEINETKIDWFVLGGQAINLWAQRYRSQTAISVFSPFTSKDVDLCFDKSQLAEIKPAFASVSSLESESGLVGILNPGPGEIFTMLPGVSFEDTYPNIVMMSDGWRVPTPPVLLRAKIWNLFNIPQEGRADKRHVAMLLAMMPNYLNESEFSHLSENNRKLLCDLMNEGALDDAAANINWEISKVLREYIFECPSENRKGGIKVVYSTLFEKDEAEQMQNLAGEEYDFHQAKERDPMTAYLKVYHHHEHRHFDELVNRTNSVLMKFAKRLETKMAAENLKDVNLEDAKRSANATLENKAPKG
jgi:hypothetical protein